MLIADPPSLCPLVLALQLCDLYENDSIFDKFDCCMSGRGDAIATGSYNNLFRVFGAWNNQDLTLEASRDPMRKRLQTPTKVRPAHCLRHRCMHAQTSSME